MFASEVYKPIHGLILAVVLINLTVGAIISWSSPIIPKLTGDNCTEVLYGRPLTKDEATWMTSLVTVGAAVGTIVAACITDRIGKKIATLVLIAPSAIGYALISSVHVVSLLVEQLLLCQRT
ncbi:unnamed protein product [Callosobruchus maculatus]|uniref:Major facilitator superfamily (MFS) profile domain-containing protein n=1 Tax=Callosobruchus maculatus TaxID=64391 RepID=A0A653BHQ9_CALMS|nr:unnamed protein product [Callosobruchus maculatus]